MSDPVPSHPQGSAPTLHNKRVGDIVALATLPAIWSGAPPVRIAESLAAALFTTIEPKFIYVSLNAAAGRSPVAVAQIDRETADPALAEQIHGPIIEWTRSHNPDELLLLASPANGGALRVLARAVGVDAELGVIAIGYDAGRMPYPDDYVLLAVAASQAATAVQNAHLLRSLRDSEERFATIVKEAPLGVYLVDAGLRIREMNPVALPMFRDAPNLIGQDFEAAIHDLWPRQHAMEIVRLIRGTLATGEPYVTPERIEERLDQLLPERYEWRIVRTRMPDGGYGALCYFRDVSEHVAARQHLRLLLDELNHRVKNTLATVQSVAVQTLRNASSTSQARDILQNRLFALAQAHDVLTREHWEGGDLHEVVSAALAAHLDTHEHRFHVDGPAFRVRPRAVLALSMALHELATNAIKYGALSNSTGTVHINWQPVPGRPPHLAFTWKEAGGPPVVAPRRRGFGSRLIEHGLAQDLRSDVLLDFEPHGLICSILTPMQEIDAPDKARHDDTNADRPGA